MKMHRFEACYVTSENASSNREQAGCVRSRAGLGLLCCGCREVSEETCRQNSSLLSALQKDVGSFFRGDGRLVKHLLICISQDEDGRSLAFTDVSLRSPLRLNPKNVHQRPTVALLCGPHVKGAQGISCGRHLSNHDVHVILFLPNFVKMLESITNELNLFSKTQGQQVSSVKGKRGAELLCSPVPSRRHHLAAPQGSRASRGPTVEQLCCCRCFRSEGTQELLSGAESDQPFSQDKARLVQHVEAASR